MGVIFCYAPPIETDNQPGDDEMSEFHAHTATIRAAQQRDQDREERETARGFTDRERFDAEIEDYWRTLAKLTTKRAT
jgi:hypothetical protein